MADSSFGFWLGAIVRSLFRLSPTPSHSRSASFVPHRSSPRASSCHDPLPPFLFPPTTRSPLASFPLHLLRATGGSAARLPARAFAPSTPQATRARLFRVDPPARLPFLLGSIVLCVIPTLDPRKRRSATALALFLASSRPSVRVDPVFAEDRKKAPRPACRSSHHIDRTASVCIASHCIGSTRLDPTPTAKSVPWSFPSACAQPRARIPTLIACRTPADQIRLAARSPWFGKPSHSQHLSSRILPAHPAPMC